MADSRTHNTYTLTGSHTLWPSAKHWLVAKSSIIRLVVVANHKSRNSAHLLRWNVVNEPHSRESRLLLLLRTPLSPLAGGDEGAKAARGTMSRPSGPIINNRPVTGENHRESDVSSKQDGKEGDQKKKKKTGRIENDFLSILNRVLQSTVVKNRKQKRKRGRCILISGPR